MFTALLGCLAATAATLTLEAEVDADLRHVRGTLTSSGLPADTAFVDPLSLLPEPGDDLNGFRTFPGPPNRGHVRWTTDADGVLHFEATLPRRFGALGATSHGLFANGGWHPTPEGLPVVDWVVHVRLPDGTTGALADTVATDALSWEGRADRASLAVVRRGVVTELPRGTLLTRGHPRKRLVRELSHDLATWPGTLDGVAVEGPLRRRLVRPGAGLAYVSDRAYRLTPGLQFAHRLPVSRGIGAAWSGQADFFLRELQAAGLSQQHAVALDAVDARQLLGVFAWVPQVQGLLSSRRMAFYSEVLDLTWPGDPVRDDIGEVLRPSVPGTVAAARLDDRFGDGTALQVAEALQQGIPLAEALPDLPGLVPALRALPPRQDYQLEVTDAAVSLTRVAPADSAPEVVVLRIDGDDRTLFAPPGVTEVPLTEPPRRVALDPEGHLRQRSRAGDTWPPRYTVTAAGWISTLNLRRGQVYGALWASLRRQYDTRHIWSGTLSNSRSDLIRAGVGHTWKVGPLVDGFSRRHAVRLGGSGSVLDPRFAATDGVRVATDLALSWRWDTRVSHDFPTSGERVGAAVYGGVVPGTAERWVGSAGSIVMLGGLSPRVVVATRLSGAVARSTVPHRLLTLGGEGAMRSIPVLPACPTEEGTPCAELATERGIVALEYRWAPIRNWSVPFLLFWGTELQLTGGFEATLARVGGEPVTASGVTAGIMGVGDLLGAEQTALGATFGWPLSWRGLEEIEHSAIPEVYVRMTQAF